MEAILLHFYASFLLLGEFTMAAISVRQSSDFICPVASLASSEVRLDSSVSPFDTSSCEIDSANRWLGVNSDSVGCVVEFMTSLIPQTTELCKGA